jgi:hypothetical protein
VTQEAIVRGAPLSRRDRHIVIGAIVALLGTAIWFRLMSLSSMPGVSGDEGWWGVNALAWLSGRPYQTHTTSGNPTDLFFLIPVALVHTIAPPSFQLLRIVPVLANLLALPMGFWLVRRAYGTTTAWIFTVALAILPTAIAHSRICQDPSQSVFWTGLVIGLSLIGLAEPRRAWLCFAGALLIFPIALWTHPTNVFVAPFLMLPFAAAVYPLLPASRSRRLTLFAAAAVAIALGLAAAWAIASRAAASHEFLNKPFLSIAMARMIDFRQWFEFAANNARLFNGVTIYHYFSGARPATFVYDAGFVIVFGAALWRLAVTAAARRSALDLGLIAACAATWLCFFAFAGPAALRPHAERWGLCLLVPGALVLARGIATWIDWRPEKGRLTIAASALLAAGLLASFYVNYFREFATTGGRSHLTYVTAPIEPKQQALERILASTGASGRATIATQEYWLHLPIAYLATPHPSVSVVRGLGDALWAADVAEGRRLFFVEFANTPQLARADDWIRARGLGAERTLVRDAGGRDHLVILEVTPAPQTRTRIR